MRHYFMMISLCALAAPWQVAMAQQEEAMRLKQALYFDCALSPEGGTEAVADFDVSYLVYSDRPNMPQINFRDPQKIVVNQTGWAARGQFVLSRQTSDGSLFLWAGQQQSGGLPQIEASIELVSAAESADESFISLRSFKAVGDEAASASVYSGKCKRLSGEDAYYRFSKGGAE